MSSNLSDNKFIKPSDLIKNSINNEIKKNNILINKIKSESSIKANSGKENFDVNSETQLSTLEDEVTEPKSDEKDDFYNQLITVLKQSKDRKFIDNKILELDYYKNLSYSVMKSGCSDSSRMAKNFLKTLDQTKHLLEDLWKFYA